MSIMKQIISEMVGDYLNESYEDDLVESIFEEVSEETWEAIEEAILNELSPATLKSYYSKAKKSLADNQKTARNAPRQARNAKQASDTLHYKSYMARYATPEDIPKDSTVSPEDSASGRMARSKKELEKHHELKAKAITSRKNVAKREKGIDLATRSIFKKV